MQFLSNFRQTSWIRKLKPLQMARICCPVGFSKSLLQFLRRKLSQIGTENDKNPKLSNFHNFYAIPVTISRDSVDWNVENVHHGSSSLSSSLQR